MQREEDSSHSAQRAEQPLTCPTKPHLTTETLELQAINANQRGQGAASALRGKSAAARSQVRPSEQPPGPARQSRWPTAPRGEERGRTSRPAPSRTAPSRAPNRACAAAPPGRGAALPGNGAPGAAGGAEAAGPGGGGGRGEARAVR